MSLFCCKCIVFLCHHFLMLLARWSVTVMCPKVKIIIFMSSKVLIPKPHGFLLHFPEHPCKMRVAVPICPKGFFIVLFFNIAHY